MALLSERLATWRDERLKTRHSQTSEKPGRGACICFVVAIAEKILLIWFAILTVSGRAYLVRMFRRVRPMMWIYVIELVGWVVTIAGLAMEPNSGVALAIGMALILASNFLGIFVARKYKHKLTRLSEQIDRQQFK